MRAYLFSCLLLACLACTGVCLRSEGSHGEASESSSGYETVTARLLRHIESMQEKEDTIFRNFAMPKKRKGSFGSNIKLNFHGQWPINVPRMLDCYDNNAFVPLWVTTALIEARMFGAKSIPKASADVLVSAIDLVAKTYSVPNGRNESTGE